MRQGWRQVCLACASLVVAFLVTRHIFAPPVRYARPSQRHALADALQGEGDPCALCQRHGNCSHLSDRMAGAVRVVPSALDLQTFGCSPFCQDPDPRARTRMAQVPLDADHLASMSSPSAPAGGAPSGDGRDRHPVSWCAWSTCQPESGLYPTFPVFHLALTAVATMADVCLVDGTMYLIGPTSPPGSRFVLQDIAWGNRVVFARMGLSPQTRTTQLHLSSVESVDELPADRVDWLRGPWVLATPLFRYGQANPFHALTEDLYLVGQVRTCGGLAAVGDEDGVQVLLLHGRPFLGTNTAGRIWDLALGNCSDRCDHHPSRAWYLPKEVRTSRHALCFERAHIHAHNFSQGARDACDAAGRARAPPDWRGWPAPKSAGNLGRGLAVEASRRLGVEQPPALVSMSGWRRPRITIITRRTRRLLNAQYLADALAASGLHVTLVSFECLPMAAQIAVAANSSTIIGVHGAGLTMGVALAPDAAVVELRTAPCAETDRYDIYNTTKQFRILPGLRAAVGPQVPCPPPWKLNAREKDAVADISAVARAIADLDPVVRSAPAAEYERLFALFQEPLRRG